MKKPFKFNNGFTLIEILIIIAITTALAGIGVSNYFGYRNQQSVDAASSESLGTLRDAQQRAISQDNSSAWGVYVNATTTGNGLDYYEVFSGASYAAGTVSSRTTLSSDVQFSVPAQGQTLEINFAKSTGLPDSNHAITVVSKRNSSIDKTITLNTSTGIISIWVCGNNITFTYGSTLVTYGTVSHNDECWLDRNLGASGVATAFNDSNAYGDLFQWGRLDDSHQTRTSGTTTTLSSSDNPGHSNFIKTISSPYDWRSPQNDNLWQGVSGTNNPCPSGWRLPTSTEWNTERNSWSSSNATGAFASSLKLTVAGDRFYTNASLERDGSDGLYWSSTLSGASASDLSFNSSGSSMGSGYRSFGFSVRCFKE